MRPLVLLILATGLACRDTKALLVVNRHGSRYSYSNADPPSLRTELTRNGLRMSYLLGRFLRQRYAAFFPARFNSNENVVVASSANRCRLSAQAILMGLYDFHSLDDKLSVDARFLTPQWDGVVPEVTFETALPLGFQPIPIHSYTPSENFAFQSMNGATCGKLRGKLESADHASDPAFIQALNGFLPSLRSPKFDYRKVLGKDAVANSLEFIDLVDFVNSMKFRGEDFDLPPDTHHRLHRFEAAAYYHFFFKEPLLARYQYTEFARDLVAHLESVARAFKNDPKTSRFILLSGHDLNIMSLLVAAELAKTDCHHDAGSCTVNPPYSSSLVFEVYQDGPQLLVDIRLNDEPVPLCQTGEGGNCTLDGLVEKLKSLGLSGDILSLRDEYCRDPPLPSPNRLPLLVAFNLLVAGVCGGLIWKKTRRAF